MGRNTVPSWALEHLRAHLPADAPMVNVRRHARGVVVANTRLGAVVVTKRRFGPPRLHLLASPRERVRAACPDCGMRLEFRQLALPATVHCGQCGRRLALDAQGDVAGQALPAVRPGPQLGPQLGSRPAPHSSPQAPGAAPPVVAGRNPASPSEDPHARPSAPVTAKQAEKALAQAQRAARGEGASIRSALRAALAPVPPPPAVEAELVRLRGMRQALINSAAHELQTPMTPLLLSLRMLEAQEEKAGALAEAGKQDGMAAGDEARNGRGNGGEDGSGMDTGGKGANPALRLAVRNAKRLEESIARLVKVSQVQAGQMAVALARVDVRGTARKAVAAWQPRADAVGIRLRAPLPAPVRADADEARILEVLDHLLSNALRFTPAGGKVTVSVRRRAGTVELAVTDTGVGVPAGERARVLEPFVQLEAASMQTEAGLGLGLFFAKAIVDAHAGTLRILDNPHGPGTRVAVSWPMRAHKPSPTQERRPTP